MVVNASNREKIVAWLDERLPDSITIQDQTIRTAMFAVQGPKAIDLVQPLVETTTPITGMRYYTYAGGRFGGVDILISRTVSPAKTESRLFAKRNMRRGFGSAFQVRPKTQAAWRPGWGAARHAAARSSHAAVWP